MEGSSAELVTHFVSQLCDVRNGKAACAVYNPGDATYGSDIGGAHFVTSSWRDCQKACNANDHCQVWKLTGSGCYLKHAHATAWSETSGGVAGTKCEATDEVTHTSLFLSPECSFGRGTHSDDAVRTLSMMTT